MWRGCRVALGLFGGLFSYACGSTEWPWQLHGSAQTEIDPVIMARTRACEFVEVEGSKNNNVVCHEAPVGLHDDDVLIYGAVIRNNTLWVAQGSSGLQAYDISLGSRIASLASYKQGYFTVAVAQVEAGLVAYEVFSQVSDEYNRHFVSGAPLDVTEAMGCTTSHTYAHFRLVDADDGRTLWTRSATESVPGVYLAGLHSGLRMRTAGSERVLLASNSAPNCSDLLNADNRIVADAFRWGLFDVSRDGLSAVTESVRYWSASDIAKNTHKAVYVSDRWSPGKSVSAQDALFWLDTGDTSFSGFLVKDDIFAPVSGKQESVRGDRRWMFKVVPWHKPFVDPFASEALMPISELQFGWEIGDGYIDFFPEKRDGWVINHFWHMNNGVAEDVSHIRVEPEFRRTNSLPFVQDLITDNEGRKYMVDGGGHCGCANIFEMDEDGTWRQTFLSPRGTGHTSEFVTDQSGRVYFLGSGDDPALLKIYARD